MELLRLTIFRLPANSGRINFFGENIFGENIFGENIFGESNHSGDPC